MRGNGSDGIHVEGLTKTYRGGQVRALNGVSLSIAAGEAFGIIGPNGAGKTTFLGCLLGFLRPDSGRVTIDGLEPDDPRGARGHRLPARASGDGPLDDRARVPRCCHHALRAPAGRRIAPRRSTRRSSASHSSTTPRSGRSASYSRGMLQRLGLAQALLGNPRYVFLDEPASGVDPAGVVLFRRLLIELKSRGATLVLNSHQLDQVERVCDRVAFVSRGHVEAIETVAAGATVARVLRVRWSGGGGGLPRRRARDARRARRRPARRRQRTRGPLPRRGRRGRGAPVAAS